MTQINKSRDFSKSILVLVVVPILIALIGLTGQMLSGTMTTKEEQSQADTGINPPESSIESISQTVESGGTGVINTGSGDIAIGDTQE